MRLLLLLVGLLLTVGAGVALLAALVSRELRVRRRAAVDAALAAASTTGRSARRRSRRLSGDVRRAVLLELADRVSSETLRAQAPGVRRTLSEAEGDLRSRRWVRRCRGLRTLMTLGLPVPPLLRLLADRHPRVRALACAAAADRDEPELLYALVRLLSDPHPLVRFSALDAVGRRGSAVVAALGRALDDSPLLRVEELEGPERGERDDRRRAGPGQHRARRWPLRDRRRRRPAVQPAVPGAAPGVAGTLPRPLAPSSRADLPTSRLLLLLQAASASAEPGLAAAVRPFAGDARALVRAAAVAAMAALGGHGSDLLLPLEDPDGRVRAAAAAAVGRTGDRALAGRLAARLRDRDHAVRQAAAASLAVLGPGGALVLRAALRDPDPYAADAARSALGLPPLAADAAVLTAQTA